MWFSQSLSPRIKVGFQVRFIEGNSMMTIVSTAQSPLVLEEKLCIWINLVPFLGLAPNAYELFLNKSALWPMLPHSPCSPVAGSCLHFLPINLQICCSEDLWPPFYGVPVAFAAYEIHSRYYLISCKGRYSRGCNHTFRTELMTGAPIYIA